MGGTRLQEGVAALVGIPRARLALLELAEARLPHLSVADAPTTGGVVCRRSGRRRRDIGGRPTPEGYRLAARGYRLADRLGIPVLSLVDTPGADPGPAAEKAGLAPAIGEALDALLTCRAPTLALVHGEGGSGGAVAAAAADLVLMTPDAYLAAIGPEGAAATLRRPPPQCADLLRLTPADSLALGVVDAIVTPSPAEVARRLRGLVAEGPERVQRRQVRWSATVPFAL